MMPVRVAELSHRDIALLNKQLQERALSNGDDSDEAALLTLKPDGEVFMALARVYSGVLRRDSDLFVLGHRHDPLLREEEDGGEAQGVAVGVSAVDVHGNVPAHMRSVVTHVPRGSVGMYIMLGPSVFPVEEVAAGNIVGIIGLEGFVLKTATLSDTWACHPMRAITFQAKPMVQVAVEPLSFADLRRLEHGLQSLYQFDPVVEIGVDDSGQNTIMCLGELHLEQCVKALTERFAK
jgi:ribosome assembly protein 1